MDGIVVSFNGTYGFIQALIGKSDAHNVYFHRCVLRGIRSAPVGARVSFSLVDGLRGPQAADVKVKTLSGQALWPDEKDEVSEVRSI